MMPDTHVGMLLRSIAHRDVEKLYEAAKAPRGLPAGYTVESTFWIVLAALVRYLSERTAFSPGDLVGDSGHAALQALIPIIFEGEWWRDPTTGAVFAWYDLQLCGPNRDAWQKLWKEML